MVRSWLDGNEERGRGSCKNVWRWHNAREQHDESIHWHRMEWLPVLAQKDVRERCDIELRPSCHQAAAVSYHIKEKAKH